MNDDDVKFPDSDRASVLANLARWTPAQHAAVAEAVTTKAHLSSRENTLALNEDTKGVHQLLHFIKQEKSYFEEKINPRHIRSIIVARAKLNNVQIPAQSGAFLLFGDDAQFENSAKGQGILERVIKIPGRSKIMTSVSVHSRAAIIVLMASIEAWSALPRRFDRSLQSRHVGIHGSDGHVDLMLKFPASQISVRH